MAIVILSDVVIGSISATTLARKITCFKTNNAIEIETFTHITEVARSARVLLVDLPSICIHTGNRMIALKNSETERPLCNDISV